jgi:1-acyl-sn-glycerol-3-phosphate acyltransferase
MRGLDLLARELQDGPRIVVSNHSAWWDPMLGILLANRLLRDCDGYALMDARNLRRLPFLGRLGGFGVELGDALDGVRALRYAARLLVRPGVLVWVFPQGRERPVDERPLGFAGGAALLARMAGVPVVPAALRYEFGEDERPTCWASFGSPLPPERDQERGRQAQEQAVVAELERIQHELLARPAGSELLARPAGSELLARPAGGELLARPAGGELLARPAGSELLARPAGSEFRAVLESRPPLMGRLAERALAGLAR